MASSALYATVSVPDATQKELKEWTILDACLCRPGRCNSERIESSLGTDPSLIGYAFDATQKELKDREISEKRLEKLVCGEGGDATQKELKELGKIIL